MEQPIHRYEKKKYWLAICFIISFLCIHQTTNAQGSKTLIEKSKRSNIHRPKQVPVSDELLKDMKLPDGFVITKFAEGLGFPRFMVVGKDSSVYITDRDNFTLTRIKDVNNDGYAEKKEVLLKKKNIHGIDRIGNRLYLATCKEIMVAELKKDGTIDSTKVKTIINDLPDCGQHKNRTVRIGPDSMMYICVGSTCNSCAEGNDESAAMLVCTMEGKNRRVYARGLRNTIGFDWNPIAKTLWGFDHGIDELGDDMQREELNKIMDGADYGWPYVIENNKFDIHHDPKGGVSHEEYAKKCTTPVLTYTAHASPMDFRFYTGTQFPEKYRKGAFAAMRGSWNRSKPSGYKLLFINFDTKGEAVSIEEFLTGFLTKKGKEMFGRPCGIAIYNDGSLLISDDAGGVIYRITYDPQHKKK